MNVITLIPAFNEAASIAETVRATRALDGVQRVLVIDDASTDATAALAREAGADVVTLPTNSGKGAALDAGVALIGEADVVLLLDGDLGSSAAQAAALLDPLRAGIADMSVARFPRPARKAGFGLVVNLARTGIRLLGGPFDAHAPLSGQRALTRRAIEACTPFEFGYGVEVALTIRALRAGLNVVEVETTMSHAATGRDLRGFVHRGRQFAHVALALARIAGEKRGA